MTVVLKVAWLPFFFLSALAFVVSLKPAPTVLSNTLNVEQIQFADKPASANMLEQFNSPAVLPTAHDLAANNQAYPYRTNTAFTEISHSELQQLSDRDLFNYLLSFREQNSLASNFNEREYELFIAAMSASPTAALDYMVQVGHNANSEFFYNFLYSDLLVSQGFGDAVVNYVNNYGANLDLIELLSLAQRSDEISIAIQQQALAEFTQGNVNYYGVLMQTDWINQLSRSELIMAFNNSEPSTIEDPLSLVTHIASLNEVGTYSKILEYLEQHPNRYRIYLQVRHVPGLAIENSLNQMMLNFNQLSLNDQVHTALIALDYGDYSALEFLAEQPLSALTLSYPVNAELALYRVIESPRGIGIDQAWIRENLHYLSFNPHNRRFEY